MSHLPSLEREIVLPERGELGAAVRAVNRDHS
jgi:hypothetical protein